MSPQRPIPVLIYHSLAARATAPYRRFSMDPGQFAEQMEHIAAGGYTSLTVADLVATMTDPARELPVRPIVITFDDGFEDMHSVALPVLTRLGLRSTAYVVTRYLGGTSNWLAQQGEGERQMLSPDQVRDLDAAGVEIGAHGDRHLALDAMPFSEATRDIDRSRLRLEEIVGHPVASFAYPYGYYSGRIKRHVQASGFESACGVKQRLSYAHDDRFAIARAIVGSDLSMDHFQSWIRGEGLAIVRAHRVRPQTQAWRLARRVKWAVSGGVRDEFVG